MCIFVMLVWTNLSLPLACSHSSSHTITLMNMYCSFQNILHNLWYQIMHFYTNQVHYHDYTGQYFKACLVFLKHWNLVCGAKYFISPLVMWFMHHCVAGHCQNYMSNLCKSWMLWRRVTRLQIFILHNLIWRDWSMKATYQDIFLHLYMYLFSS